jgi:hypothetical protein
MFTASRSAGLATAAPRLEVMLRAGPDDRGRVTSTYQRIAVTLVMVLGAALLVASGVIHLHLWMNGYGAIHIVGPLFLIQAISAFAVAAAVVVTRWATAALVGAALLIGTFAGLLVSAWHGIFGFQDSLGSSYAGVSLVVEATGSLVLIAAAMGRYHLRRRHS